MTHQHSPFTRFKIEKEGADKSQHLLNFVKVYPEQLLGKLAKKTFTTLGCNADEFFEGMGFYFVEFAAQYG